MIKKLIWLIIILGIIFWGVPKLLEQLSIFIEDLPENDDVVSEQIFIIPPILDALPAATNSAELKVSGYAEQADRVEIFVNNISKKDIRVKKTDQSFSTKIPLFQGENEITVKSYDSDGNVSNHTKPITINYIASGPDLIVDSPVDEDEFETREQTIQVRGITDSDASVTVNGRWVRVADDGSFIHDYRLGEGDNTIEIVATGPAGNTSAATRYVRYSK